MINVRKGSLYPTRERFAFAEQALTIRSSDVMSQDLAFCFGERHWLELHRFSNTE
jgi:hypothetical protein